MKTFKTSNKKKKIRACKKGSAADAIGMLEKNMDIFVLTYGQFSLMDGLLAILDQTGPAHINISTWTAAHSDITRSSELLESAEILSFRMIVDRSFKTRQPKYYEHMIGLFGQESIREINTHAKFITIRNDKWDIVVRTSMNLNGNPRLENIEISDNVEFVEFFETIVDDVFDEIESGGKKNGLLDLKNIQDTSPYILIKAKQIKRVNLNEPTTTHTIRD